MKKGLTTDRYTEICSGLPPRSVAGVRAPRVSGLLQREVSLLIGEHPTGAPLLGEPLRHRD